jgi:hypothetical protein
MNIHDFANMSRSEKDFVWAVRGMGLTRVHAILHAMQKEADETDRRNRERNRQYQSPQAFPESPQ